jgi:hypothetical protein
MNRIARAALVLGAVLAIALTGNASANTLHQVPPIVGTTATNDCGDGLGTGWVFVNTGSHDATGATLTAIFAGVGAMTVAGYTPGDGVVHYFVSVSPADTLLAASDSLDTGGRLNLSHVCFTEEMPSSSPAPSPMPSSSPSESPTPSLPVSPTPSPAPLTLSSSGSPSDSPSDSPSTTPPPSEAATPTATLAPSATPTPTSTPSSTLTPTEPPTDAASAAPGGASGSQSLATLAGVFALAVAMLLTLWRKSR